jgi:hypothetical protein
MHAPRRLAQGLLLAVAVLATTAARADEWDDARKEFRDAQKSEEPSLRADAYVLLAGWDSPEAIDEMLSALSRERHPVVMRGALRALGSARSPEAVAAMGAALEKRKGEERLFLLVALGDQPSSPHGDALLLAELAGKDAASAAQAARALGSRRVLGARDALLAALRHDDGRVRLGAAWALQGLADPPKPPLEPNQPDPGPPPSPDEMREPAVLEAMVAALVASDAGVERAPLLAALERITGQAYGLDAKAWRALIGGADPSTIRPKPVEVPYFLGIPLHGRRIAFVIDKSTRFHDLHPFSEERLREICEVPGARSIAHFKMLRVEAVVGAHLERYLEDAASGTEVEVIYFNKLVNPLFGRLTRVGSGMRKTVKETIEELKTDDGIAAYDALTAALDLGGRSFAQRWKKGPDEIVFVTVNIPTKGEITDPAQVASAIGLRAQLAGVRVHTVGILTHAYDLCRSLAAETGGIYRDLTK